MKLVGEVLKTARSWALRKLERQIDLSKFALAFVMVRVASNTLAAYLPRFDRLQRAVETVRKGEAIHLDVRRGH